MKENEPHYEADYGIRPARKAGKVRGVAREIVPGGAAELWSCDHDHAPGVRDCQVLTVTQRGEAVACAEDWLRSRIAAGQLPGRPVLRDDD